MDLQTLWARESQVSGGQTDDLRPVMLTVPKGLQILLATPSAVGLEQARTVDCA